ncbi:MAG TPA: ABC transporter permease [Bryobacteraceae bacterium]|nr:ABC transporter permease [Bryobacteraceae bacterium]
MHQLLEDLRYGLRTLLKTPGATLAAVAALSLGIGANSSVFSVINAVLLRPLPYKNPGRLVAVWGNQPAKGLHELHLSPPDYRDLAEQNQEFDEMGAFRSQSSVLTGRDLPEQVESAAVSPGIFRMLGAKAVLGRTFAPDEDQPEKNSVAVLSHGFWRRRFNADPHALGSTLTLDGRDYTVIGVAAAGFELPGSDSGIWIPYTPSPADLAPAKRGYRSLTVIAMLKAGVPLREAETGLQAIASRIAAANPDTNAGYGIETIPLAEQLAGGFQSTLWMLLGAVAVVLLIACANVANLLLVRAGAREKEMAVRSSLGASPGRIMRQLLTESVLLGLAGGVLGLALAFAATPLLIRLAPESLPRAGDISIDWRVLAFTFAVSILTGIVFGLAPAAVTAGGDLNSALRSTSRGASANRARSRMRDVLVVSQIACCVVLLTGAGLLLRSFARLLEVNPGFRTDHLLTMRIAPSPVRYSGSKLGQFYRQILDRLSALPGVQSAGVCRFLPLGGKDGFINFQIEGRPALATADQPRAAFRAASAGYFAALGIPLLKGRLFDQTDAAGTPKVAIINEKAARLFWPDEDPVGKRILSGFDESQWSTIIGVVGNLKHAGLDADADPETYYHYLQIPPESMNFAEGTMALAIRTGADPEALTGPVRSAIRAVDPDQPVFDIQTMQDLVQGSVAQPRFRALLLGVFGGLALLLAAIGLYGVIAYSVTQRVNELGIRMALGARRGDIVGLVVAQGLRLAAVGIGIGLALALAGARFVSNLLFGVGDRDPVTLLAALVLVLAVALAASLVPAWKATRIDPSSALRAE